MFEPLVHRAAMQPTPFKDGPIDAADYPALAADSVKLAAHLQNNRHLAGPFLHIARQLLHRPEYVPDAVRAWAALMKSVPPHSEAREEVRAKLIHALSAVSEPLQRIDAAAAVIVTTEAAASDFRLVDAALDIVRRSLDELLGQPRPSKTIPRAARFSQTRDLRNRSLT